jgi:hypothetical protein
MSDRIPRTGPGAPEFEVTDEKRATVKAMAAYGIPQYDIARVLGCSAPTLRKYFGLELDTGSTEATAMVAQTLFNIAVKKDGGKEAVTACIFWLKARGGWRDYSVDPGKKDEVREAANHAGFGTDWGDDLSAPTSSLN